MRVAANVLVIFGASLMMLAGVGVLKLPDLFARMHAATKSASLGLASVLIGAAFVLDDPASTLKLLLAVVFQFMTAPVAAHVIGRSAYRAGARLWEGTHRDDLAQHVEGR